MLNQMNVDTDDWSSSSSDSGNADPNVVISIEPIPIDRDRTLYFNENMYALYPSYLYCKKCQRFLGQLTFDAHILTKTFDEEGKETQLRSDYFGEFEFKTYTCKCAKSRNLQFDPRDYDIILRELDNNGDYVRNGTLRLENSLSNKQMQKIHYILAGHSDIDYIVDQDALENSEMSD
jgi:hypothetical protein